MLTSLTVVFAVDGVPEDVQRREIGGYNNPSLIRPPRFDGEFWEIVVALDPALDLYADGLPTEEAERLPVGIIAGACSPKMARWCPRGPRLSLERSVFRVSGLIIPAFGRRSL